MKVWIKALWFLCILCYVTKFWWKSPVHYIKFDDEGGVTYEEYRYQLAPISYSLLIFQIIGLLITDILRHKPVIIVSSLCLTIAWGLFLWTEKLYTYQIALYTYFAYFGAEVAYFAYIFAIVDKEFHAKAAAYITVAILMSEATANVIGVQVLPKIFSWEQMKYFSFCLSGFATLWSFFLPPVEKEITFESETTNEVFFFENMKMLFSKIQESVIDAYSNFYVLKWSVWSVLAYPGFVQIHDRYGYKSLVQSEDLNIDYVWSHLIITSFIALSALLAGYLKINWQLKQCYIIIFLVSIQAIACLLMLFKTTIYMPYITYTISTSIYFFLRTASMAEIARIIDKKIYGLILGFNMLISCTISVAFNYILLNFLSEIIFEDIVKNIYFVLTIYHLMFIFIKIVIVRIISKL